MLDFSDAPYQFFPPKPSRPIISLSSWVNRTLILRNTNHRIEKLTVGGSTRQFDDLKNHPRTRLLFVLNHPSHSDAQTAVEVQRRLGVSTCFMAAYDVFLRGKLNAWFMQRNGAFSIDRESSDRKAMAAAGEILTGGDYGLTIFPEGNVHFTNDRVTPFLEGAAFIGVRAQKSLGTNADVIVVPIALKFSNLENIRPHVRGSLAQLAEAVGDTLDPSASPPGELMRIGRKLLARNLSQRGYLDPADQQSPDGDDCLFETLRHSAERIAGGLETKMQLQPKPSYSIGNRIKKIRATIHQILSDPAREIDHRTARNWADEALLVIRILSYGTPYVREKPTLDRVAETVEKLNEDLHNHTFKPPGKRAAYAHIGTPIRIADLLENSSAKPRDAIAKLTSTLESSIQSGVDTINATLDTEGSKNF
ncbi:MAG: 1-acyl-sn-glycerol-3-phosphate acyltransferase [Verrucomicrobiales bacterium]|nr:1-acyl-sn-glycerol-3-phosphate acyltransferase [Verrucomicrobiales bacterium]